MKKKLVSVFLVRAMDFTSDNTMYHAASYMRENYSVGSLNMNALAEYLSNRIHPM